MAKLMNLPGRGQTVHQWTTLNGTPVSPTTRAARIVVSCGLVKTETGTIRVVAIPTNTSVDIEAALVGRQKYLHLVDALYKTG